MAKQFPRNTRLSPAGRCGLRTWEQPGFAIYTARCINHQHKLVCRSLRGRSHAATTQVKHGELPLYSWSRMPGFKLHARRSRPARSAYTVRNYSPNRANGIVNSSRRLGVVCSMPACIRPLTTISCSSSRPACLLVPTAQWTSISS